MTKPEKRCIFCGNKGLSKEHVWPQWLTKLLPDTGPNRGHSLHWLERRSSGIRMDSGAGILDRRNRPPNAQQLRVVCRSCNGGWMSGLQKSVKPTLLPLVNGEWPVIGPAEQSILAAWATMATMVFEYADIRTVGASPIERRYLMENGAPPWNWFVWIGRYGGTELCRSFWHRGFGVFPEDAIPAENKCNGQVTVFCIGKLVVLSFGTSNYNTSINPFGFGDLSGLRSLWHCFDGTLKIAPDELPDEKVENLVPFFTEVLFTVNSIK